MLITTISLTGKDFNYHPTEKMKRKGREVLYHRQTENKLTPVAKCGGNFNVRETKRHTDKEDSSKSYESNAF